MLIGVVIVHGPEQAEAFHPEAFADLDGLVVVSGEPIPGAISSSSVPGFNAGANRDIGILEARSRFPGCSVVLLDGDCIPGPTWAAAHRRAVSTPVPTVACGARLDRGADPRTKPLHWQGTHYGPSFRSEGNVPTLPEILAHRVTWTCNMSINSAALARLEEAGKLVHGVPRIFSPMFDGLWGGEDTGLGILAHHAGCRIITLAPAESCVTHIPHPSRITSVANLRRVHCYEKQVRERLLGFRFPSYISKKSIKERLMDVCTNGLFMLRNWGMSHSGEASV